MFEYVIRRLILMIPTFLGTTLLVFVILQSVPSGPFEQAVLQIKMATKSLLRTFGENKKLKIIYKNLNNFDKLILDQSDYLQLGKFLRRKQISRS